MMLFSCFFSGEEALEYFNDDPTLFDAVRFLNKNFFLVEMNFFLSFIFNGTLRINGFYLLSLAVPCRISRANVALA